MVGNSGELLPRTVQTNAATVQRLLLEWFGQEGREFPWRSVEAARGARPDEPIHDPYEILVSEVMLQQTQTARVVAKLPEFLGRFPTVEALAGAGRGELLRAWQGMGYNRRALRLQETAQAIVERYDGRFPSSVEELRTLPGIGKYTASAIACFAFGRDVPVVDVNIIRVLSRLFFKCHTPEQLMPEPTIDRVAAAVVPTGDAYHWHQGLMDLGATVCTARTPACHRCPMRMVCLSAFPLDLELFHRSDVARPEPMLRGEPRRIWRGRIIEVLRNEDVPILLSEVIDRILPSGLIDDTVRDRRDLVAVAATLIDEGLIERKGGVYEGDVQEHDRISLPES